MPTTDPFKLERFVEAQEPLFATALAELKEGRKESHWMWFIFPQLRGLGRSSIAQHYGISSLDEAKAYLGHSLLGSRLILCTETTLAHTGDTLETIFGPPDDMKFRSSMTLFAMASEPGETPFQRALNHWCGGKKDPLTEALLAKADALKCK